MFQRLGRVLLPLEKFILRFHQIAALLETRVDRAKLLQRLLQVIDVLFSYRSSHRNHPSAVVAKLWCRATAASSPPLPVRLDPAVARHLPVCRTTADGAPDSGLGSW